MTSTDARIREQIVRYGKSLFDRGLTAGSSGNISVKTDDGWLLTPTNVSLGELDPAKLSKLDWKGNLVSGDAPSKEHFLHRAVYETRTGAAAIVHLHSTHSVAVSMLPGLDPNDVLPPLTAYYIMKVGHLKLIPYFRPGDARLGDVIREFAHRHSALLLANHGPVVSGSSLDAAVAGVEELEETAKLFLLVRNAEPKFLTREQIRELVEVFNLDY